ncbi:MAG: Arc family DNA-binding protein [Acidobacteriota bacterium]|jgi:plasmid stability protein
MPSLTIRDLPEDVLEILRARARRNHRSLNGEVLAVLEAHALAPVADPRTIIAEVRDIQQRYRVPTIDHAEIDALKRRGREQ